MLEKIQKKYRYSVILLKELVRADFKIKYQDSVLGYLWSVLQPIFLFTILYLVFSVGLKIGAGIDHWPVAMLAGIVLWQFFTDVTKSGLKTVVGNGGLMRKIKFPRYITVVSGTVSAFITLALNSLVVIVFAIVSGVELSLGLLLVVPLILEVFVFSLGVAFFLGAVYVKFRDIEYIWDVLARGLFYASAIIYPIGVITQVGNMGVIFAQILLMNPVAQAIQDIRYHTLNDSIGSLWTISDGNVLIYILPIIISIVVFILGVLYFRKRSPFFAEEV